MRKYPVGMVLGGWYYWSEGIVYLQNTRGYYWSSSAYTSATIAYRLVLDGTNSAVLPALNSNKRYGFSLRCLAKKGNNNIENPTLPIGNTTGEFQSLYNQYPTYDQMRKYPVGMVLGGYYYWGDGTLNWQGTYGYYWSSSAYTSATRAYRLGLDDTNSIVGPASHANKYNGFPLRCLDCRLAFTSFVWCR